MIQLTNRSFRRELRRSLEGCRLRFSFGLSLFEQGYCLDFFGFLIPLLFLDRWRREPHEIMETWGFTHFDKAVHFNWGSKCKVVRLPWSYEHMKCEVLRPDGSWTPYVASYEERLNGKEPDGRWTETYPYTYTLKNGKVQERTATIYVERREWRQRWLAWCPFFAMKRQSISIEFNDEVGEKTGSWKGGVVGTGYEMKPGETPLEALQRMEQERKF